MKRKTLVVLAIAVVFVLVSIPVVATPVRENYCVRNMNRLEQKITRYVESDKWEQIRRGLDVRLSQEQLTQLTSLVNQFVERNGVMADDPMHPILVSFIVGVYEIMALLIGNNEATMIVTFGLTSMFVLPALVLVDCFFGFFVALPLVLTSIIGSSEMFSLQDIIYKFGVIGASVYLLVIIPLLVVLCVGVMVVAFPTVMATFIVQDFKDTYIAALDIILPP